MYFFGRSTAPGRTVPLITPLIELQKSKIQIKTNFYIVKWLLISYKSLVRPFFFRTVKTHTRASYKFSVKVRPPPTIHIDLLLKAAHSLCN